MKKSIYISGILLLLCSIVSAQSNKLDKKLQKAIELANNNKLTEAETYVVDVLKDNPEYGEGWEILTKIRYKLYEQSKKLDGMFDGNITVTTKDENGKEVEGGEDSLATSFVKMLTEMKPSKIAYNKYIYTMRKSLLFSNDATYASFTLRASFIDIEVDTAVSKKALKYYDDAEEEFSNKNFEKAASYYKRAISEQPDFYKARLYLGDCYYFTGNYVEAIKSFKESVEKFPTLLEPRKYLVDAYAKEKLYKNCMDEAINTMLVYPDLSMFMKLEDAIYLNGKKLDIKWTPRAVFPNKIEDLKEKGDINRYEDADKMEPKANWVFYAGATDKVKDYCNAKGIINKSNTLTKSRYLEVYSWEEMLKNSDDPSLAEAKRMDKEGYLDCYALVTCFHYDLYDQYVDFVTKNREKVIAYYNKFIIPQ